MIILKSKELMRLRENNLRIKEKSKMMKTIINK